MLIKLRKIFAAGQFIWVLLIPALGYSQAENNEKFIPAIEDNSMYIEEAYNQEERVVQHISNLVFPPELKDGFYYSFTQEWPAFGLKHQLSYTLQYTSLNGGMDRGLGDIVLNYRYQLLYKEDFAAFSPRLSVIIPSGNQAKGLGSGSWGIQCNFPFSKRWTNHFINHLNAGATYQYKIRQKDIDFNRSLLSYFAGISSIWLVSEKFNLMLECLSNMNAGPDLDNNINYSATVLLAPAFRYAINLKKVQIVPGISLPFSFNKGSKTETGIFVYLSFEHGY
jgi:hypothetical protein